MSAKLEQRFDELVHQLRPYALRLQDPEDKRLLQLWLGRLNHSEEQPSLRNDYLFELYRQLKKNCLRPPFTEPPEPGKLMPLSKIQRLQAMTTSSCNEFTETSAPASTRAMLPRMSWPSKPRSKSLARRESPRNNSGSSSRSPNRKRCDSSSPTSRSGLNDIISTTGLGCSKLLRMYRERVESLSKIVEELECQNERLKQKLTQQQQCSVLGEPAHMEARVKQLLIEVGTLKAELAKVSEIKDKLKSKHEEIVERHRAQMTEQLESMKRQLESTRNENKELHEKIDNVELQLQEMTLRHNEAAANRKTYEQHWQDEVDSTQQRYEAKIKDKEAEIRKRDEMFRQKEIELRQKNDEVRSLSARMQDLQRQLESKSQQDCKLQSALKSQYGMIMDELSMMRNNIERVSKKDSEEYNQQILAFAKNIDMLLKHTTKLKTEYEKKIYHIKKENEKVVNDLQKQLVKAKRENVMPYQMEKFEEIAPSELPISSHKKAEYVKLLKYIQSMANEERKTYLEKLSNLDHQLCPIAD